MISSYFKNMFMVLNWKQLLKSNTSGLDAFKKGLIFNNRKRLRTEVAIRDAENQKKRKVYMWNLKKRDWIFLMQSEINHGTISTYCGHTCYTSLGDEAVEGGGLFVYSQSLQQTICDYVHVIHLKVIHAILRTKVQATGIQRNEGLESNEQW